MRIHVLLAHSPLALTILLLLGQILIISLHFFKLLLFFDGHVVFEHTSHSSHIVSLLGIFAFLNFLVITVEFLLTNLLLNPFFLNNLMSLLSLPVSYKNIRE